MILSRSAAGLGLALLLCGCGSAVTVPKATEDVPSAGRFPHGRFGLVLDRVVSADGLVDYAALAADTSDLDAYLAEAARVAPDVQTHLFPTEEDREAYWINVHNACALKGVLVLGRPANLKGSRLDSGLLFKLGGRERSLDGILARAREFADPRVHAALVRGRRGGPPLAKTPYQAADLDARLDEATRGFVADPRNVSWNAPSTTVRLSLVILQARGDFERQTPDTIDSAQRLIEALNHWRVPAAQILATRVEVLPFDERLNDIHNR